MSKIRWWARRAWWPLIITGYVLAGILGGLDLVLTTDNFGRTSILVLVGAGIGHVIYVIDRNTTAVSGKIDDSVGPVWDAGKRAGSRETMLELGGEDTVTATVHRLPVRP